MTIKEMESLCKKNNGKCAKCKLNCIEDWYDKKGETWCFKELAKRYRNKYIMHKDRKEDQKAQETIEEYNTMCKKYEIL